MARTKLITLTFPPQAIVNFNQRICKGSPDDCWIWIGDTGSNKYGYFSLQGRRYLAHRIAYFFEHPSDSQNLLVCHKCDNPSCCNPNHLFLGTDLDNNRDMVSKGRNCSAERFSAILKERAARGDRNGSRTHPEKRLRGENHPASKLLPNQIKEIRRCYSNKEATMQSIADRYHLGLGTVSRIIHRLTWSHIE